MCSVPWGVRVDILNTVRGVQYRGGYHEYRGEYLEYRGDTQYSWSYHDTCGGDNIKGTVGVFSTVEVLK